MKIYNLPPSEGLRAVIGYHCDYCGLAESGEEVPKDWITEHDQHYCLECQDTCKGCFTLFSLKYSKEYFKQGFCENCQEKYLPEYMEDFLK